MSWKERAVAAFREQEEERQRLEQQKKDARDAADAAELSGLLAALLGEPVEAKSGRVEVDGLTFVLVRGPATGGGFGGAPKPAPPPTVAVLTACKNCREELRPVVTTLADIGSVAAGEVYCHTCYQEAFPQRQAQPGGALGQFGAELGRP